MKDENKEIGELVNLLKDIFITNPPKTRGIEDLVKFDKFRPILLLMFNHMPTPNRNSLADDLKDRILACKNAEDAEKLAADINNDIIIIKNNACFEAEIKGIAKGKEEIQTVFKNVFSGNEYFNIFN